MTAEHRDAGAEQLARMDATAALYREHLRSHPNRQRARDELRRLGFDPDGATVAAFQIGFAPLDDADEALRDRLILPVLDGEGGHVVALTGRAIRRAATSRYPSPATYVSSPESPVFPAGRTLYGLWQAADAICQRGHVIVVEAIIDVLVAHAAGDANVVAPLGTAFAAEHARLLARYTTRVTIVHDDDHAGRVFAAEAARACSAEGLDVQVQVRTVADAPSPEMFAPWSAHGFRLPSP